jgi:methyltransferase (TIGR00027 family)
MLSGVSATALGVAAVRAAESERTDRLFDDPLAAAFVAAAPPFEHPGLDERTAAALAAHVIIRTPFYDAQLLAACAAGCRQVALLAAGLDTRAFRLDWPEGTRLFELDLPPVLAFKEEVLREQGAVARCERVVIATDLLGDWPAVLVASGFDAAVPTAWLVEGLLVYLSADEAARVLEAVGALSAPGSRLVCERSAALPPDPSLTAMWKGGLGDDTPAWLERHGWRVELHAIKDIAASFGRPVPGVSASAFVTASR